MSAVDALPVEHPAPVTHLRDRSRRAGVPTRLRRPARRVVGRAAELTALRGAVEGGYGAVLAGPAGIGKSALAGHVAEGVEATGERVERIVATEATRPIPFGALAPLLSPGAAPPHLVTVVDALRSRLGATPRHPQLLVVDDAHLLDDPSAAALLALVTAGCIRIIATVRTGEPTPDAIDALWKENLVERHDITPFDRAGTRHFLSSVLGGDVAIGTASLLWQRTRGNALYLGELARDACSNGHLVVDQGVWIWRGGLTVPPRLADLLERRFDGLAPAALDALGALVLAEPVPLQVLERVATLDGVAALEAHQLVATAERDGVVWYRFAHPMLAAVAAEQLAPTRRRRVADALLAAPSASTDPLQRAMWQLDASAVPDVEVLRAGADAVFLTQPKLARRLAERALPYDPTPRSALLLADVHAELGEIGAARAAQDVALAKVRSDGDLVRVRLNQVSLTAFSDRRPDVALERLAGARAELGGRFEQELDSMAAQLMVFSGRPAAALTCAERLLATDPERSSAIRASSTLVLALTMADRSAEALFRAGGVLAELDRGPTTPYTRGIAHMAAQVARFVYWSEQSAPATDVSGRWPVPPASGDDWPGDGIGHPLFAGGRLLLSGHAEAAVAPLREAVAQQCVGEGLLRSEAVALLTVALAATGQPVAARQLLRVSPPDRVALYCGLRPWAESAIEAAEGGPRAVDLAFQAYEEARAAGGTISAVAYLAAAARYGASARAFAELERWGQTFESPICVARATGIAARARADGSSLLEAAELHAELGLFGDAGELSALAYAALGRVRSAARQRAKALCDETRRRLRTTDTSTPRVVVSLTRREREIASLAGRGMSDADIAATLVISVRTVESHLAATYRKLGINSRRDLRQAL